MMEHLYFAEIIILIENASIPIGFSYYILFIDFKCYGQK